MQQIARGLGSIEGPGSTCMVWADWLKLARPQITWNAFPRRNPDIDPWGGGEAAIVIESAQTRPDSHILSLTGGSQDFDPGGARGSPRVIDRAYRVFQLGQ